MNPRTNAQLSTDVLIVGAGPVGLTLAMDLAGRGVRVTIAEVRRYAEAPSVKCNHVSARTMEQFRRLGVSQKLRNNGLPEDFPNDVVFRTSMTGMELSRIDLPCRRDRYTYTNGPDGWWPTSEPPHRINQIYLEPILLAHVSALPNVTLLSRTQLTDFTQDSDGIQSTLLDLDSGEHYILPATYLVGCDGGSSCVRKRIGVKLEGDAVIQRVQSTYMRAPKLKNLLPGKLAWCYYSVNPRRTGTVFAIDGNETWLVHNHLKSNELEFDSVDRDQSIRDIIGVDAHFDYEVLSHEDWIGRRLVADRFRDRRVFIAGDAAHLWVPYAGYGMNAGIADALNLGLLLGARVQGWGAEGILDAYEAERQPITAQVSRFAMDHAQKMIKARNAVPNAIEQNDAEGAAARSRVGEEAYSLNVQQFCCAGLNFGYYYADSPIIVKDDEEAPAYSMGSFTPSTVPGCRAPHFWLDNGHSLYDEFGPVYTLLVLNSSIDCGLFMQLAIASGVPVKILDLSAEKATPETYRHALLICRSDHHVVWRGNSWPNKCSNLVGLLRGASLPDSAV